MSISRNPTRALTSSIARAITDPGVGGGGSYAAWLDSLRALPEQLIVIDPSDLSTLWQDTARTVPVTAVGQLVKGITDTSSRGHHLTSATGWVLEEMGGKKYLAMTAGAVFASASFAWGSGEVSLWAGIASSALSGQFLSFGVITDEQGSFQFRRQSGGILAYIRGAGAFSARSTPAASAGSMPMIVGLSVDMSQATIEAAVPSIRINGTQPALKNYPTYSGGTFGTYPLLVGGVAGRLYGLVISAATVSLESGEVIMAARTVAPQGQPTPLAFLDTGSQEMVDGLFQLTSAFAHVDFQTTATSMDVSAFNNLYGYFPGDTEVGVYVNGEYNQSIEFSSAGVHAAAIALPAGDKAVSLVNGLQSYPAGEVVGTFVQSLTANAPLTPITPPPSNRLLIYGDSISVGGNSSTPTRDGWVPLLRKGMWPDSVALEGWGHRSLWADAATAPARAAFVAKLAAYAPARIWLAIGTNDYGLNKWSAASFGTAYAALLDGLHAALPSATIFCQTPLLRTTETANGSGSTLGDYRTQIATAVSTRTAYATLVDGTAIMTTASLADGIHPTTAGHVLYASAVIAELGI